MFKQIYYSNDFICFWSYLDLKFLSLLFSHVYTISTGIWQACTEILQNYYVIACKSVPEYVKVVPEFVKLVPEFDKIYIDLHKFDKLVPEFEKLVPEFEKYCQFFWDCSI